MALPISYCLGAQIPVPDIEWWGWNWSWAVYPCIFGTETVWGYWAQYLDRPCASSCNGAAEDIDIGFCGHGKRPDGHPRVQQVSTIEDTSLLGQSVLGQRVLCRHRGSGWRENSPICEVPGGQRTQGRAKKFILKHMWGQLSLPPQGARQTNPLSGVNPKPGPQGQDLYKFSAALQQLPCHEKPKLFDYNNWWFFLNSVRFKKRVMLPLFVSLKL